MILTRPLTEVSMAALFGTSEDTIRLATGEDPPRRSLRERLRLLARARRAYRMAIDRGVVESSFQRGQFLAAKQLVYLERYGRMYLPEMALLGDREFLQKALAGAPRS